MLWSGSCDSALVYVWEKPIATAKYWNKWHFSKQTAWRSVWNDDEENIVYTVHTHIQPFITANETW